MKNILSVLILLLVVGFFGYTFMGRQQSMVKQPSESAKVTTVPESSPGASGATMQSAVKEFSVEGGMFYFKPNEIKVKKGDTVKITLTNKEGLHDWVLDEFNAKTKRIKAGETDTVTFVADKVGTFEYYCSVGNHRAMGMKGNLIVE
jgi:nitrosocyanin